MASCLNARLDDLRRANGHSLYRLDLFALVFFGFLLVVKAVCLDGSLSNCIDRLRLDPFDLGHINRRVVDLTQRFIDVLKLAIFRIFFSFTR